MIDSDKAIQIINEYKNYFPAHWEDEKYKWQAVKHFQDNWDINAENFGEMFKKATDKTSNLLASGYAYPRGMILEFSKADDEATRNMFVNLFDENLDLSLRIETFINTSEEIRAKYDNGTWKKHYQNTNSVSTYLWLMYPDKYYIYKYELFKAVADELDDTYIPGRNGYVQNVIEGFKMYDEICEILKADNDIRQMLDKAITDNCYTDPELKTITVDFGFYLARFYKKTIANIPATWLLNYNPTKWDWEKQNDEYSYKDTLKTVKNGGAVFFSWRCHSNQVKAGDRVFIIKLGAAPRGIFATGYAASEPYEGTYTDDKGQDVNGRMIDICITGFLDYNTEELISQDILNQKFPDQQWSPQASGISIKSNAARWLIENWNNSNIKKVMPDNIKEATLPASNSEFLKHYTKDNFLKDVFITEPEYDKLRSLLLKKKNIILQGAPGVGKTFSAKRLAYSIIGEKNENRICMVQFHQNYSYEDFIMGYRPAEDGSLNSEVVCSTISVNAVRKIPTNRISLL